MAPRPVKSAAAVPPVGPTIWRRRWAVALALIVASLGAAAVREILTHVSFAEVAAAIGAVSPPRIAAALGLTAASYLLLTFHDTIGLAVIGKPLPWRASAVGAFTSHALGYNFGWAMLTANAARFRLYGRAGLSMGEAVQVGAIASVGFWSGVAALGGLALLVAPGALPPHGGGVIAGRCVAVALLLAALSPQLLAAAGLRRVGRRQVGMPLPSAQAAAALAGVAILELLAAAGALFVLLPVADPSAFPAFLLAYALAIVVAVVSHVPGGLGVFEAVVLAGHPGDHSRVLAALVLYRVVYYFLPLAIAAAIAARREAPAPRRWWAPILGFASKAGRTIAPPVATLLVFAAGVVLLASGALPGVNSRLSQLDGLVPLPFIEGSHLGGSLVGTALLLVAPALNARLRSGWLLVRPLLLAGAAFSLLKGLDYEEASLQLGVLALVHYARPSFYRRGGVASEPLQAGWLLAAAAALALSIGAGLLAYRHVPYQDQLWWQFALEGNAPRFLRATFAAGVLLTGAALWPLFLARAPRGNAALLPAAVAARALAAAPRTDANLAFTGDKRFIVSADGDAFIMYGVRGRTWIAMGDPVGPLAAWDALAWRLRRACDADGGRLCFYQVSGAMLPILVDLGMSVMKYGEEAHVALADFSLEGRCAKDFRLALRRAADAGLGFEVVPPERIEPIMDELRAVSAAWLNAERGREKSFSLGTFNSAYLRRFPVAVVRCEGRVVAFANVWIAPAGSEVSVDLMRHLPGQPPGTMDMMLVRLFEWGQARGYGHFNLGVAPLSGLPRDQLAPAWAKVGRILFERGGRFYRFQGLRAFKAKFRPSWHARYIGQPSGLGAVPALLDLVAIVNRRA